ncbi:MAG TPA: hypothetical protein VGI10_11085, partial [Polyangiaceae bacterium]
MNQRILGVLASVSAIGALLVPRMASAQQVESETVTEKGGPSQGMLASGIVTGGISYSIAAYVALTSNVSADHRMVVPLAGPWLALSGRPACGGFTGRSCDTESSNKVLIATDGVFQAVGAFLIIDAFLNPRTTTVTRTARVERPPVYVVPTAGTNGYGIAAMGYF